ncbi:non-ribosomal peptide synthetase [Nostoc sphaeroides]|uniref:Amino acid adenylation domain protein n=1 Tax=Nostoc sphaeroides CCNUC1 TaxID=2653204 RepID=A0A5P8WIU8_9NOSO|nr:non-ribosomal peptide synthetase [Nostoc sphaeroides]QFS52510.1 amino acid adenylation domain protein [Nostoc sphaeroides CCNUC1]
MIAENKLQLEKFSTELCLHQLLEIQAVEKPNHIAFIFENEEITYQQINAGSNQLAQKLIEFGIKAEIPVCIFMERCLDMVIGILGTLKAGGVCVPLDPEDPEERRSFILKDTQVSVILTQEKLVSKLTGKELQIICIDDTFKYATDQKVNEDVPLSDIKPENLAFIFYTSGSTGKPKGVMLSHRACSSGQLWLQNTFQLTSADKQLLRTSISVTNLVREIFWPIVSGTPAVIARPSGHKDVTYHVELITKHQITVVLVVPVMLQGLLDTPGFENCHSLRYVFCSSDTMSGNLPERFFATGLKAELYNLYGLTEALYAAFWKCNPGETYTATVPIGYPAELNLYILNPQMQPVANGESGELYIGGVGMAQGYFNRPELTAEKFVRDPNSQESNAYLYKTGDLACTRVDGSTELLGRLDYQVKIRGYRVEVGEIEVLLRKHPALQEAVVIGREDTPGNKRLVAYIILKNKQQVPKIGELRDFLGEKLPEYMLPSAFVILETLPLTYNGKIDRRALPVPTHGRPDLTTDLVLPRTQKEHVLAEIWSQVLDIEPIGINDNFFELGGDSILGLLVSAKASRAGLKVSPTQVFLTPTVTEMAAAVSTFAKTSNEQDLTVDPAPLTPFQNSLLVGSRLNSYSEVVLLTMQQSIETSLLEKAFQNLLEYHDALNLHFQYQESNWQQLKADALETISIVEVDLSTPSSLVRENMLATTISNMEASLKPDQGSVLQVTLLEEGNNPPKKLLIVAHRGVLDNPSWQILLEDLQTVYEQLQNGEGIQFPPKTTAFSLWAKQLPEYAQLAAIEQQALYWLSPRQIETVAELPKDSELEPKTDNEYRTDWVSSYLTSTETQALLTELPIAYRTRTDEVLLTALVQNLIESTGSRSVLIDLINDGRTSDLCNQLNLSRTVGCFTTAFPVLLDLEANVEPGEALKSIKEQLRQVPHQGIIYGLLKHFSNNSDIVQHLTALPQASLSFSYLGDVDRAVRESYLFNSIQMMYSTTPSVGNQKYQLEVYGFINAGQLQIDCIYCEDAYKRTTVEQFLNKMMESLRSLIRHCQSPEAGGFTPSDFTDFRWSQTEIDEILAVISSFSGEIG